MGYRSDVRILTTKKGFEKLNKYVNEKIKTLPNQDFAYNLLEHLDINYENEYSKYFGWNCVKWYYEDVEMVMDGLNKLAEDDYSYRFARIGENYDDYEEEFHESESIEDEQDLDYPSMTRYFEDNYIIEDMNLKEHKEDNIEIN